MHKFKRFLFIAVFCFIVLNFQADPVCFPSKHEGSQWTAASLGCGICGLSGELPKLRESHLPSIGILHLGTLGLYNTWVMASEDGKTEAGGRDSVLSGFCNFGAEYGYAYINSLPNRGITTVDITYGSKDEIDFAFLEENLCPSCMDKVLAGYREAGTGECRNVFLVDFQALEFYPLPERVISFIGNDYFFHVDHNEGRDRVLIVYAPGW